MWQVSFDDVCDGLLGYESNKEVATEVATEDVNATTGEIEYTTSFETLLHHWLLLQKIGHQFSLPLQYPIHTRQEETHVCHKKTEEQDGAMKGDKE